MKKGCFLSLLLLLALIGAYYFLINLFYGYPDNLIGALVVGFMNFFGIGMLMNVRNSTLDLRRLNKHLSGKIPADGEVIAAAGIVHALGSPLKAPFSGKECVFFDYRIFHEVKSVKNGTSENVAYGGCSLTLSEIRTAFAPVKLLSFPSLEGFGKSWIPAKDAIANAQAYLAANTFEDMSGLRVVKTLSKLQEFFSDDDGVIKEDWKMSSEPIDLENEVFEEERLEVGQQVCAFGKYSAARGGIVADFKSGNLNRVFKGGPNTVAKKLKSNIRLMLIFGLVFLTFSNGALWLAIHNAPKAQLP